MQEIERVIGAESIENGMRFWKWRLGESLLFVNVGVQDFVVFLPKFEGQIEEFTIVTKEWSPAMLEHYNFSDIGMHTMEEDVKVDIFGCAKV